MIEGQERGMRKQYIDNLQNLTILLLFPVHTNTDIIRIFAEPSAYNMASCRVPEKARFQFEGFLRNHAVKNGTVLDIFVC